jgi:hypothetical protein
MTFVMSRPSVKIDTAVQELVARVRARQELESQAIAEGKSDIASDRPLTPEERWAIGLDDEDENEELPAGAHSGEWDSP